MEDLRVMRNTLDKGWRLNKETVVKWQNELMSLYSKIEDKKSWPKEERPKYQNVVPDFPLDLSLLPNHMEDDDKEDIVSLLNEFS